MSYEVLSLHAVVKEFGENLQENPAPSQLAGLRHVAGGCQKVLNDLKVLTDRYRSLGSQNKRTRDRFKWGGEDIAEIRLRLISNTALLNAFISTSQITVQKQLQQFLNEHQRSGKENSVISSQSISSGDSKTWRDIRRELEGFGISVAAFNTNKAFIFEWLQKASRSGKLDNSHDCSISTPSVSSENSKLWREIRKDLEGVSVTPRTFNLKKASVIELFEQSFPTEDTHKAFIFEWLQKASCSGSIWTPSISSENSKLWREIREDLEEVGVTPTTFNRKKASIIKLFEQSFQTEDLQQNDDDHMEENDADALVSDAEPYPCKDRVNEWLLQRLENSPIEQMLYRTESNQPALDHKSWWSLITQHWDLDGAGDVANSIRNPPGLTEDSLSMTKDLVSDITANSSEITETQSLPKNSRYERPSHAAPSYQNSSTWKIS
ncbi:MAG: hypothetical protein Q9180_007031 [Flavoplaca navasiana]